MFPEYRPSSKGGRPPVANRAVFTCLLFILKTGIGWREDRAGAVEAWSEQGLWAAIFQQLLGKLRAAGRLDLEEVLIDGGLIKAPCGGENAGPTRRIEAEVAVN